MKLFPMITVVLSLGLVVPAGLAQETSQDAPKPAVVDVAESGPAHLGGEAPALAIGSDVESRNVLVAGFSLGAAYDSRGLYNSTTNTFSGEARYFVQPSIAFQRTFSTGGWTLSYTPGFGYAPDDQENTQYTQNLAGDLHWRPSERLLLHVRQDYSLTDNPFETVGRVDLLPGLGGPLGPNYSGVLPDTKRTSLVTNADLSYRVGEHSAIGMTGGFQKFNYDSTQSSANTTVSYVNSEVITGSVFYSRQFSETLSAGMQMTYMDIYSTGAEVARTQAPAPMLFVKMNPAPHTEITLYAGPEYARTREVVTSMLGSSSILVSTVDYEHHWYPTYGGTVAWHGARNGFDVQADRRVAAGGGVLEAAQSTSAGAGYRVRAAEKLLAEVRANYADQKGIGLLASGVYFRSLWVGGGPVVEMSRSWSLRGDVAYVHQEDKGLGAVAGNHMLVQGSLEYRFHKSLGE